MHLAIDGWYTKLMFHAAHISPALSRERTLHGHTYVVHCRVLGEQDDRHWVMDFTELKGALREIVEELDHRTIIPTGGRSLRVVVRNGQVEVRAGKDRFSIPRRDVALLDAADTTVEELAGAVLRKVRTAVVFPPNVARVEIGIDKGMEETVWAGHDLRRRSPKPRARRRSPR